MSVLCANGTHVTLTNADRCTCGAAASGQPYPLSGGIFPGYTPSGVSKGHNPYGPPKPPTPPVAAPDVPIRVFEAAQRAGASHLSMDGKLIYCERFGEILVAEWDGEKFGSWWNCVLGLPADAVAM